MSFHTAASATKSSTTDFYSLQEQLGAGGLDAALEHLAERLKSQGRYHELFDARLMQARQRLNLPAVLSTSLDELPEPIRTQLENAYLDACKEVGHLLLDEGKIGEAWRYLRPVSENAAVADKLQRIEPDDENIQQLIEVALHEGVAPLLGFRLVLENYGTCNAITTFDAEMYRRGRGHQQDAAAMLVRHLHRELMENVRFDIRRQEGADPSELTLAALVEQRDWLFAGNNYHIDTTHLASVVRFARLVEDPEVLRLAFDLTEYGRRLGPQYHFAGEEPFTDNYVHNGLFFAAQLGQQVEQAVSYFRERADAVDIETAGTAAIEVYIVLLSRIGRHMEAFQESIRLLPDNARSSGLAPSLLELAGRAGDFERLLSVYQQRGDLLGYATALAERERARSASNRLAGA